MGLIRSICSAICSSICSGISNICSSIGSSGFGHVLGSAVSKFTSTLNVIMPQVNIVKVIIAVANVVVAIAEALGIKKKEKDEPEELAMKAEKDDKKPEDYESTEAYIKHLQEEIELSKEDKEKLNNMTEEEKAAYRATGTYIYLKGINEKLGLDDKGMKKPELSGINAELVADLAKAMEKEIIIPSDFVTYCKHILNRGMSVDDFKQYLHGGISDVSKIKNIQGALSDAMKEINPNLDSDTIENKICNMCID